MKKQRQRRSPGLKSKRQQQKSVSFEGEGSINQGIKLEGWLQIEQSSIIQKPASPEDNPMDMNGDYQDLIKKARKRFFKGNNEPGSMSKPLAVTGDFLLLMNQNQNRLINPKWSVGSTDPPCTDCFYFRLSGLNMQFTQIKDDLTVVGSIALGNISQVYKINKSCVYIRDNEGDSWKICSRDGDITTWYEGLKGIFTMKQAQEAAAVAQAAATSEEGEVVEGEAVEGEAAVEAKEAPKEVQIKPLLTILLPSVVCNKDWSYENHGKDWKCGCKGKMQSPCNIPNIIDPNESDNDLSSKIQLSYEETSTQNNKNQLEFVFEENLIRLKADNFGSAMTQDGVCYQAVEVVFHTPAEHTIDGEKCEMEMQVIHKATSDGHIGKKLVIAHLFKFDPDYYLGKVPFLDDLAIFGIPSPNPAERLIKVRNVNLNRLFSVGDLLDLDFDHAIYEGSLTYPPCDENTKMVINLNPLGIKYTTLKQISLNQLPDAPDKNYSHNLFKLLKYAQTGSNRIEICDFSTSDRKLTYQKTPQTCPEDGIPITPGEPKDPSDPNRPGGRGPGRDPNAPPGSGSGLTPEIGPDGQPIQDPNRGHWERVTKSKEKQFQVDDDKASGVPGAFVVSAEEAKLKNISPSGNPKCTNCD